MADDHTRITEQVLTLLADNRCWFDVEQLALDIGRQYGRNVDVTALDDDRLLPLLQKHVRVPPAEPAP